jgi:hypothetical protein
LSADGRAVVASGTIATLRIKEDAAVIFRLIVATASSRGPVDRAQWMIGTGPAHEMGFGCLNRALTAARV